MLELLQNSNSGAQNQHDSDVQMEERLLELVESQSTPTKERGKLYRSALTDSKTIRYMSGDHRSRRTKTSHSPLSFEWSMFKDF